MDALSDIADRCIDDTVAELSLSCDVLRYVILAFIVKQHFIDVHLDDITLHQPIQRLVDVLYPEAPDQVVTTAVRNQRNSNSLPIGSHQHSIDDLVEGAIATHGSKSRKLIEIDDISC